MADVLQDQVAAQAEGRWSLPHVQRSRAMRVVQKDRAVRCGQSPPLAGDAAALESCLTRSIGRCWVLQPCRQSADTAYSISLLRQTVPRSTRTSICLIAVFCSVLLRMLPA